VARFYLAINLHNYDQRYEEALQVLRPLVEEYPQNPLFQLAIGDLYAKLGRKLQALEAYRAAATSPQHGGAGLPPEDPIAGAGGAEWHGLAGALKDFPPAPGLRNNRKRVDLCSGTASFLDPGAGQRGWLFCHLNPHRRAIIFFSSVYE